jgi:hypothetical protein
MNEQDPFTQKENEDLATNEHEGVRDLFFRGFCYALAKHDSELIDTMIIYAYHHEHLTLEALLEIYQEAFDATPIYNGRKEENNGEDI